MRRMISAALAAVLSVPPALADPDWNAVGQTLGKEGTVQPDGIYRIGLPRSDLKVTLDGIEIKPALALGSWLAFQSAGGNEAMAMGDLVLTQEEVNPVMKTLIENGLEVTALHNHLLRSEPATMYMHVSGHGDAVKLASALREAVGQSRTPLGGSAANSQTPTASGSTDQKLDTAGIDRALGRKGKVNGGVYQISIPRAELIKENGMEVPESMGSAIAINFQPIGVGKAAITGDFVLTASEVNPVVRALRAHDIEITALHNHMLDEEPRLFFMHFWANDEVSKLASGLGEALRHVNRKRE
ncbi:DUF1259 domain-containing protein [Mesorhizobium sp.]|uniref:DUF1259 domain-containing protein n=1 Tax=Mesorhizobium sp. TaxID=1871066 RepID=UPI00121C5AD2|nr:DUF1259 domain-containing protein [Mesorhizobium sp.]TIL63257.1 MAG: DUF1259 domain-containing protein [Mesorhizobium sp.]